MKVSLVFFGSTEYSYDLRNNLTSITNDIGGVSFTQLYGYGATSVAGSDLNAKDNLPTIYTVLDVPTNYHYNNLNQLTERNVVATGNTITNAYTYKMNGTLYTNQLATETIEDTKYAYEYDNVGNIISVKRRIGTGAETAFRSYTYDGLNRMTSETNGISNYKSAYKYDSLGNITEKNNTLAGVKQSDVVYTYTSPSVAGWDNLLTKITFKDYINNTTTTQTIDYDAIGNPISYRGATLSWYGRQLKRFTKNGITTTLFYDADGLRTLKIVNGVKTEYQYVGDKMFYEKRGDGNSFYYFYDSYGKLSAIYHYVNGTRVPYHVVTNAQGDVMALYNWSGTKVAEYSYDAWGNCSILSDSTSTHIATLNRFRYRGYYSDSDLGLYYLQSRYYDSAIGRFINADSTCLLTVSSGEISDKNLFNYCDNNPVIRRDTTGNVWETVFDLVSLGFSIYDVVKNPNDVWAWVGLAGDAIDLIPFVCGVGEAIKVAKVAKKTIEIADDVHDSSKVAEALTEVTEKVSKQGWHVGDEITKLTKAGNKPSWSTVRQRYWKNEAFSNASSYSPNDVQRMQKGLAPLGWDGHSMELHHPFGRDGDNFFIFEPLARTYHRYIHYGR